MDEFLAYLAQFGDLTAAQRELITQKTTRLPLRKGEYFQRSDAAVQRVGFIVEGIFRVCHLTAAGEEVTHYFVEEQNMLICLTGLEHPPHSAPDGIVAHYVQAITDCQVLVITASDLRVLSQAISGWDALVHKAIEQALSRKMRRVIPILAQNGTTRYTSFPQLANRVPLAYLASYLGLTQSSLSRIRKAVRQPAFLPNGKNAGCRGRDLCAATFNLTRRPPVKAAQTRKISCTPNVRPW